MPSTSEFAFGTILANYEEGYELTMLYLARSGDQFLGLVLVDEDPERRERWEVGQVQAVWFDSDWHVAE